MMHLKILTVACCASGYINIRVASLLVLLLSGFMASSASIAAQGDEDAQEVFATAKSFVAGGARVLALRSINAQQKPAMPIASWMRWERLRIRLYRDQADWKAISVRSQRMPAATPRKFRQWLLTEAAKAELGARRGEAARTHLRALVWAGKSTKKQMAYWRRLIIRSYLIDNKTGDAKIALLRYKADYRATSDVWQVLHARVLMRSGEHKRAFGLLGDIQTLDASLLRLHAALHSGIYKPGVVMSQARRLAGRPRLKPEQKRKIWLLAAQAARKLKDQRKTTAFLELALAVNLKDDIDAPFFPLQADDLWQSYIDLAEAIGNRERLLVGDYKPWLQKAKKLAANDGVSSRAIYGLLATRASVGVIRDIAHQRLTDSLFADAKETVARAIYARSARFDDPASVPDAVRYKLANAALKVRDIRQAARWMKELHKPPAGQDVNQWMLRRARTLVYAGETQAAIDLLHKLLDDRKKLANDFAKRTVQVLFDLQAVQEHGEAYELLRFVFDRVDNKSLRRELLYWMGESKAALGDFEKAAALYLRSATLGQPKGADLWGQSARYQAAEALGKAGLVADARSIFRGLLRTSEDAKRRALIERKLQQLWLLENRTTTP